VFQVRPDLFREQIRVAACRRVVGGLLAAERREQPFRFLVLAVERRGELRDRVRLQVFRVAPRPEVRDQLVLVARRQQRAQEEDVGNRRPHGVERGVARVDDRDVGHHFLADDALDDRGLAVIRFDRENERLLHQLFSMRSVSTVPTVAKTSSGALSML
jgi:hypothetical protein